MKKLDLGQTLGILANLGVIAGIVFLGVELRQNNELLVAQASFARFSIERERRERVMESPEYADLVIKSRSDAPLSESEQLRMTVASSDILDSWIWQFRELQAGRLPDGYIDLRAWRNLWVGTPGLRELYQADRAELGPEFIRFVDENVVNER